MLFSMIELHTSLKENMLMMMSQLEEVSMDMSCRQLAWDDLHGGLPTLQHDPVI